MFKEELEKNKVGFIILGIIVFLLLICVVLSVTFICHVKYTNKYNKKIEDIKFVYNTEHLEIIKKQNELLRHGNKELKKYITIKAELFDTLFLGGAVLNEEKNKNKDK